MPATPERGREGEGAPLGLAEEGREGDGKREIDQIDTSMIQADENEPKEREMLKYDGK